MALCQGLAVDKPVEDTLLSLSLEQLVDRHFISASRSPERLMEASAPTTVLPGHELQESTATSIIDALRLVPGVQVFEVSNGRHLVGIRGFETNHKNATLVLKDGRSLNIPTLNGIYWNELDYNFDEIHQIEVVRGPVASVWGANAVNGAINIVSRSARETQGTRIEIGSGSELSRHLYLRHGDQLADSETFYRTTLQYRRRDPSANATPPTNNDEWDALRTSFRIDTESADRDSTLSLNAEAFAQVFDETFILLESGDAQVRREAVENYGRGLSLVVDGARYLSHDQRVGVKAYYEFYDRQLGRVSQIDTHVADLQYEHTLEVARSHELLWTAEYRMIHESFEDSFYFDFPSGSDQRHLLSVSLQDAWTAVPERLVVTPTAKLEYHDFSALEFMGSIRAAWTPHHDFTLWGSIARAIRTPIRGETDSTARLPLDPVSQGPGQPGQAAFALEIAPNPDLKPEESLAWQTGVRFAPTPELLFDLSGFITEYAGLINAVPASPTFPPKIVEGIPVAEARFENNQDGSAYGTELAVEYRPTSQWRLLGNVSWMRYNLESTNLIVGLQSDRLHANTAAEWTPVEELSVAANLRFVDDFQTTSAVDIPGYTQADARLTLRPSDHWEISIIGRNLINPSQKEYEFSFIQFEPTEVERAIYIQLSTHF